MVSVSDALSTLNSPPLVAMTGVATALALPVVEQMVLQGELSILQIKILNCVLYALNVFATQQPGRIDGMQQEELEGLKKTRTKYSKEMEAIMPDRRGRSMVVPSGWAFVIWAPIFLGELIFCVASSALIQGDTLAAKVAPAPASTNRLLVEILQRASPAFMASQVFQTLWTASFRPKYAAPKYWITISGFMLTGIAASLNRAHAQLATFSSRLSWSQYAWYVLPLTLHFGWTTAAALVNWNGTLAMPANVPPWMLAAAGYASAMGAAAAGVWVTLTRQAPVFGGVIAWALTACATGIQSRIVDVSSNKKDGHKAAGVYGAVVMKWVSLLGAAASAAASARVSWTRWHK